MPDPEEAASIEWVIRHWLCVKSLEELGDEQVWLDHKKIPATEIIIVLCQTLCEEED